MDNEYTRHFLKITGQKIHEARIASGMSTAELGKKVFHERQTIYNWERGARAANLPMMAELHKVLGVPLWGLLPTEKELSQWQEENDNE